MGDPTGEHLVAVPHQLGRPRHGLSKTPTWNVWCDMWKRCSNPRSSYFHRYGGRGISVCARWQDFAAFVADVGPRPSMAHTLDRIDNDGDYEPGNVRWATRKEQAQNRTTNHSITAFGRTQTLQAWAEELGIKSSTIRMRLTRGAAPELALKK